MLTEIHFQFIQMIFPDSYNFIVLLSALIFSDFCQIPKKLEVSLYTSSASVLQNTAKEYVSFSQSNVLVTEVLSFRVITVLELPP